MTFSDRVWDEDMPALLSLQEAAVLARVQPETVARWRKAGRFPDGLVVRTPGGQHKYRTKMLMQVLGLR